jgi:glutathione S-transferase
VEDCSKWFITLPKHLNAHFPGREYLCDERFTVADIAVGYSLYLAEWLGLDQFFEPVVADYWQGLKALPAFQKVEPLAAAKSLFGAVKYPFGNAPELM